MKVQLILPQIGFFYTFCRRFVNRFLVDKKICERPFVHKQEAHIERPDGAAGRPRYSQKEST